MFHILTTIARPLVALASAANGAWPSDPCSARLEAGLVVPGIFEAPPARAGARDRITAQHGHRRVELTRLAVAPNPIELVSVVVPVYRELWNGNLRRLLETLEAQGLGRRLRLVAVVNNTPEVAARDLSPVLRENRQTVRFLERARGRASFAIEVIDETKGFPRNMGRLRNRGLFRALELWTGDPRRHLVVNFDADAQVSATYLADLVSYYDHFAIDALLSRRGLSLPGDAPRELFQSHHHSAYNHLMFDFAQVFLFPGQGASTPQITVRASVAAEMKGFADWEENEDLDFGYRLKNYVTFLAPDVSVLQSDRVREDGFDAARGLALIRSHLEGDEYVPSEVPLDPLGRLAVHLTNNLRLALQTKTNRGLMSLDDSLAEFGRVMDRFYLPRHMKVGPSLDARTQVLRDGLEGVLASLDERHKYVKSPIFQLFLEPGAYRQAQKWGISIASFVVASLKEFLTPEETRRFEDRWQWRKAEIERAAADRRADLRSLIETGVLPNDPAAEGDAFRAHLRRDTSLRRDVIAQIHLHSRVARRAEKMSALTVDHVVERLMARYPDWLHVEWHVERWVSNVEFGRFVLAWALEAMTDPARFPGTTRYLEVYRPPVDL